MAHPTIIFFIPKYDIIKWEVKGLPIYFSSLLGEITIVEVLVFRIRNLKNITITFCTFCRKYSAAKDYDVENDEHFKDDIHDNLQFVTNLSKNEICSWYVFFKILQKSGKALSKWDNFEIRYFRGIQVYDSFLHTALHSCFN